MSLTHPKSERDVPSSSSSSSSFSAMSDMRAAELEELKARLRSAELRCRKQDEELSALRASRSAAAASLAGPQLASGSEHTPALSVASDAAIHGDGDSGLPADAADVSSASVASWAPLGVQPPPVPHTGEHREALGDAREAELRRTQATLQKRAERAEKQAAIAAASRLQAEQTTKAAQTQIQELEASVKRLSSQLDREKKRADDAEMSATGTYKKKMTELTENIASLSSDNNKLALENRQLHKDMKSWQDDKKRFERKIREQNESVEALEDAKRLDSEMKMELARRLDSALMDNNALQEEIEKLRWDLDAMARATAPSGEGGEPVSTPVAGSGSVIAQARANVSFSGRPLHPPARPGSGPGPAPSAAPAQSGGGMLVRIQLGIKKAIG